MSEQASAARVWSRENLRYHLMFAPAICFCLAAGWFELTRALHGHEIAWVYTFEWPLFGVLFAWMWWRVVTDRDTRRPSPRSAHAANRDIADDDPGLQAWRAYLAELGHDEETTDRAPGAG